MSFDENNVLSRYYYAATEVEADIIVRITGDDPFKDSNIIDEVIELLIREELDFACNNFPPSFPEGLDAEVFTYSALKEAFENSMDLNGDFVFDELGLKSWTGEAGTGKLLTHVIFHPVQKSLNRLIQIDYTVRIQTLTNLGSIA